MLLDGVDKTLRGTEDALCDPGTDGCGGVVRFLTHLNGIAEDPPQRHRIPLAAPDQQSVELALDELMTPLAPGICRTESLREECGDGGLKTGIITNGVSFLQTKSTRWLHCNGHALPPRWYEA